ncbi:histidine phosphatase family protein [bacterium]|nr:histidine phosphatase family protein [bacterium]QQR57652.1 MAG: histidine phosphatase family protein [Candidatus Melainabacteria bacterium]
MLNLYLLRHAKSSWDSPNLSDFDRPLNERGKRTAPFMGEVFAKKNCPLDLVICSPAKRTRETCDLFLQAAKLDVPVDYEDGIYEASLRSLMNIVKRQDSEAKKILMIGHNPGFGELLYALSGTREHFPTATLASLSFSFDDWLHVNNDAGELQWILRPKELNGYNA